MPRSSTDLLFAFGLFVTLGAAPASAGGDEVLHPDFQDLGRRWEAAVRGLGVPGLAVCVVEQDEILHLQTFGVRDVESGAPVTPDTMFYIASATKPFVALACLDLVEEGRLELDAPVQAVWPGFRLADDVASKTITPRDLLCHRPGIQSSAIVFLDAYTGEITPARYDHFLAEVEPTGRVTYTNVHFTLAGRVLEAIEGRPWKEVLRKRIFEPLGMTRTTGYADWMYAQEDVAFPTVRVGTEHVRSDVRKSDATMHAAGGLGTSVSDASRWLRLQLGRGKFAGERLVPEELMDEMFREQSRVDDPNPDPARAGFGLGWMRGERSGTTALQHGGGYVGSAALFSFLPELGLGVVVLANTDGPGHTLCGLVTDDVYAFLLAEERYDPLPGLMDRYAAAAVAAEASAASLPENGKSMPKLALPLAAYVGTYANVHWGTVTLEQGPDGLSGRIGALRFAVRSEGPERFRCVATNSLDALCDVLVEDGTVRGLELELREGQAVTFRR